MLAATLSQVSLDYAFDGHAIAVTCERRKRRAEISTITLRGAIRDIVEGVVRDEDLVEVSGCVVQVCVKVGQKAARDIAARIIKAHAQKQLDYRALPVLVEIRTARF